MEKGMFSRALEELEPVNNLTFDCPKLTLFNFKKGVLIIRMDTDDLYIFNRDTQNFC